MQHFTLIRRFLLFTVLALSSALSSHPSFAGKLNKNLIDFKRSQIDQSQKVRVLVLFKDQLRVDKLQNNLRRTGGHLNLVQKTFQAMQSETPKLRGDFDTLVDRLESQGRAEEVKKFWIQNVISMQISLEALAELEKHSGQYEVILDPYQRFIPENPKEKPQEYSPTEDDWGLTYIRSREANKLGHLGEDVEVHIIDTGASFDHPTHNPKLLLREKSKSFVPGTGPEDDNGHGTWCAYKVGSNIAFAVAPKATTVAVKALDRDGSGTYTQILESLQYSASNGAEVISMSLGGPDGTGSAIERAVKNIEAAGVFFAIAAGNDGLGTVGTPGCVKEIFTVGAIKSTGELTDFSGGGPTIHGDDKPDGCAPGQDTLSAWLHGKTIRISGTSMATPHVAGLAALIIGKWKKEAKKIAKTPEELARLMPKPADVKRVIMMTATGKKEPNSYGAGVIDCVAALEQDPKKGALAWNVTQWFKSLF